jgi:hypothetical protein
MTRLKHAAVVMAALAYGANAQADAVLDWNEIMLTTLAGQNPVNEARLAATTHLAMFEAVNAVTQEYRPYLGSVVAPAGASADAAAVTAAHSVLRFYFPQHATNLDQARANSLTAILDGPAKVSGIAVGEAAATAMLALRANDGSAPAQSYLPTSSKPGEWQLTPGCPATGGVFKQWGNVTPFGIVSVKQFPIDPPPALTSKRYERAFNEIKRVGGVHSTDRTQDRVDVARFYAAVLPVRTWNPVAVQVARAQGHSLTQNARALALLNMAMSDGLVAVFENKYRYTFWRPITAIRAGDTDGNHRTVGDPEFAPLVGTPCHPSYASAHASSSYSARIVLERLYGRHGHFITMSNVAVPNVQLQYSSFEQVTSDIDDARIYGGIHFRFDQEAGARLGKRIGSYVHRHNLRCMQERRPGKGDSDRRDDDQVEMGARWPASDCDTPHH